MSEFNPFKEGDLGKYKNLELGRALEAWIQLLAMSWGEESEHMKLGINIAICMEKNCKDPFVWYQLFVQYSAQSFFGISLFPSFKILTFFLEEVSYSHFWKFKSAGCWWVVYTFT